MRCLLTEPLSPIWPRQWCCCFRDVYSPHELLGGVNQTFLVGQMECTRIDFELVRMLLLWHNLSVAGRVCCCHYQGPAQVPTPDLTLVGLHTPLGM